MARTADGPDDRWDASAALKQMVNRHVAPAMASHGYTGRTKTFKIRDGDVIGEIAMQLSVHNCYSEKEFTFNLKVTREDEVIWTDRIGFVCPEVSDLWWTLSSERDVDSVGLAVAQHLDQHACVAIEVVMADPFRGRIPENARRFALAPRDGPQPSLEDIQDDVRFQQQVIRQAMTWTHEDALRHAWSLDARLRSAARSQLWRRWPSDPLTVAPLVDSLENDPNPVVRQMSAREIGFLPPALVDRLALEEAASFDEDHQVRWAARYALIVSGKRQG